MKPPVWLECRLTLELSGGEAVRLNDWLGAARHQWDEKRMNCEHACSTDK